MTTILIKKKDTAGAPAAGDLTNAAGGAEIAVNTATKRIYTKDSGGNVVETGTNPSILNVDNIQIDVNTISSTDTNGNINLTPNGTGSVVISKLNVTGAITFDGNVTVGNSSSDTLTVNSTITSNLIFTDNTYDIGASGATRPRNIYTAGIGLFGGTLFTQSLAIGNARIQIRDNSIEEYSTDADSLVAVNYYGYQAGTTRFRDFDIYNGKSGFIATFDGATSRFGLINANPSYTFDMTGQGRVLSTSGSSSATIPSNNLFVIDSNANTGFGVCIPSTGNITAGFYVNAGANTYDGGIEYQGTTRALNLRSAGSNRVVVDSGGSVGVGAAPTSSGRLSLQITDAAEGYYLSNVRTALGVNFVYNSNNLYIGSNYASYFELDGTSGAFKWFNAPTGTAGNVATFTQTMTLDANGVAYIGGTSGTGSRLNLIKDTNSTVEQLLWLRNSGTGYKGAQIAFGEYSTTNGYITNQYISTGPTWCTDIGATDVVRIFTGSAPGTERARFSSTQFLLGTTSNIASSRMEVVAGSGPAIFARAPGDITNQQGQALVLSDATNGNLRANFIVQKIGSRGGIGIGTTEVGVTNDRDIYLGYTGGIVALGGGTTVNTSGGALQLTSGSYGGITFPASQVQSSNANTLDDYEEGSWTPDLQFGGAKVGITYTYQSGNYVRIGRQVTVWATIYLSSKGSSTGDAQLFGLPYAPSNTFYNEQHGVTGEINSLTFSGYLAARVGGSNQVQVFQNISGGAQTILNNGNFTNGTSLAVAITYTTNA
jgi:hypothetical protein